MLQEQIDSLQLIGVDQTLMGVGVLCAALAVLSFLLFKLRGLVWHLVGGALIVILVLSSCLLFAEYADRAEAVTSKNIEATNRLIADALQERYSLSFIGDLDAELLTDGASIAVEHVDGIKQKITLEIDQTGELIGWDLSGNELERVYG